MMSKELKDRLYASLIAGVIAILGAGFSVTYAAKIAENKEMSNRIENKADVSYVDEQNAKQDKRIERCEQNHDEMMDKVIDIWKAIGCDKQRR